MWYQYRLTIGFAFRISPHSKRLGRWDPDAGTGHTARHGSLPVHRLQRCPAECIEEDQSQCRLWVLTHCVRVWVSIFYSRALERNSNSIIVLHFLFYFFLFHPCTEQFRQYCGLRISSLAFPWAIMLHWNALRKHTLPHSTTGRGRMIKWYMSPQNTSEFISIIAFVLLISLPLQTP